ncbi:MAG: glycosyltransferase family 4 protein [Streptococcaceae bacterium]|jgi:1,2-diacylglycerol 3-alpha-glucosyltransferase|nr:glycosyltransferase family 4 protein [Streptococcaceae bacterium]
MRIGIFSDTYFPQISGVSTSIKTLRDELTRQGHIVYIFTTTDPASDDEKDAEQNIIRLRSVPFVSIAERRMVMVGLPTALQIARHYDLDIIHTQTEFGVGILGKIVANRMHIPVVHTLHTKYEDYLHYIANGHLIRPSMVKYIIRTFLFGTEGIICPSEMTKEAVVNYGVKIPIRVIPTGIELTRFTRPDITAADEKKLREELGVSADEKLLLSLCRLSQEKNIQAVIAAMPQILHSVKAKLIIVGDGPYRDELEELVSSLDLQEAVTFVGAVENDRAVYYYKAADFFISASTSETQGLTFTEAIAAGTPILAWRNPYLTRVVDDAQFGYLFNSEDDIVPVTVQALTENLSMNVEKFDKKLYEISSENFGRKVAEFYAFMIENYVPSIERATDSFKHFGKRMSGDFKLMGDQISNGFKTQYEDLRESGLSFVEKFTKYGKIKQEDDAAASTSERDSEKKD